MINKYLLPILAIFGVGIATAAVVSGNQKPPLASPPVQPAKVPYPSYIAGAGIIEARSQNIAIGTPVSGIVTAINAEWGEAVKKGDILFQIDDRDLQGQLLVGMARIEEAKAALAKSQNYLRFGQDLTVGSSITKLDMRNRQFDAVIAQTGLDSAKAQVDQIKMEIERRTIRAPIAGRVLQIGVRLGEFAQSGTLATPLMMLGDASELHVRVDIDENDAWRLRPDEAAVLVVRGNPTLRTPLRFVRVEPYVIPKPSLTGQGTERPDVRVLQVIYGFDTGVLPVYVGQQVDVYVETPPIAGAKVAFTRKP